MYDICYCSICILNAQILIHILFIGGCGPSYTETHPTGCAEGRVGINELDVASTSSRLVIEHALPLYKILLALTLAHYWNLQIRQVLFCQRCCA